MKIIKGILGFIYKLYIAFLFGLGLILFYFPINILKKSKKHQRKCFYFFVIWSWLIRFFGLIFVVFNKRIKLNKTPHIIVANHSSYFDIFLLFSMLSRHPFLFMGKVEILSYPFVRKFFKGLHIPVDRKNKIQAAKSFIQAKKAIEKGWSIVIFPEGGIPDENLPKMIPFKDGAFSLAKQCEVPILPLSFLSHHLLFSDPGKILGSARPGVSWVYLHDIIDIEHLKQRTIQELSLEIFNIIEEPLKKYY